MAAKKSIARAAARVSSKRPRRASNTPNTAGLQDRLSTIASTAQVVSDAMSRNEEDDAALVALEHIVVPLRKLIEEMQGGAA